MRDGHVWTLYTGLAEEKPGRACYSDLEKNSLLMDLHFTRPTPHREMLTITYTYLLLCPFQRALKCVELSGDRGALSCLRPDGSSGSGLRASCGEVGRRGWNKSLSMSPYNTHTHNSMSTHSCPWYGAVDRRGANRCSSSDLHWLIAGDIHCPWFA